MPPKRKLAPIDISDVPSLPLILKNEIRYKDNTRKRPTKENSSKYAGVYYEQDSKKWKAQIMIDGRVRSLGYYEKEEAAADVYTRAAHKYKKREKKETIFGGLDLSNIPPQPLITSDSAARFKGVKRNKLRWEARISINRKPKTLGTFDTPEEAAGIYSRAAYYLKHHKVPIYAATEKNHTSQIGATQKAQHTNKTEESSLEEYNVKRSSKKTKVTKVDDMRKTCKVKPMSKNVEETPLGDKNLRPNFSKAARQKNMSMSKRRPDTSNTNSDTRLPASAKVGDIDLSKIPPQPLIPSASSSRYKGVMQKKSCWEARITIDGKSKMLGTFDTPEEAAGIYSRAAFCLSRRKKRKIHSGTTSTSLEQFLQEKANKNKFVGAVDI